MSDVRSSPQRPVSEGPLTRAARADARRRMYRRRRIGAAIALGIVLVLVAVGASQVFGGNDGGGNAGKEAAADGASTDTEGEEATSAEAEKGSGEKKTPTTAASWAKTGLAPKPAEPYDGWVDPATSGQPWSSKVAGQLTFRGNPTRSYYGLGPVPKKPKVLWEFPGDGSMCGSSPVGGQAKVWCGTGWTGQPSVWEKDGKTWLAFGAYDKAVHFLDADTGKRLLEDFPVGDIIKGSVTVDPDGYPLLYTGSRDDYFHVVALDRGAKPEQLWKMWSDEWKPHIWNNDWDGSALVIDDYLFEGGENSYVHIVKLNRAKGADGKVTVAPELVYQGEGFDDELLSALPDKDISIENSVAISGNTMYFGNSGGLIQGWDISGVKDGKDPTRTFRYWMGDDTDASVVVDKEGFLYVASEYERQSTAARSEEVGQLVKLDPRKPDDPLVWKVDDHEILGQSGIWGTPAIADGVVYADTNQGRVMGVDQKTGKILWTKQLPGPTWQSPVVVDDVLIQGDCNGFLHAYDVSDTRVDPPELWSLELGGCIESTPAVWHGQIFVGTRAGQFFAITDPGA